MREGGAEALAFDVAGLAGPEAALPHGSPGRPAGPRRPGAPVRLRGAGRPGYRSDMTRTLFVGEPSGPRPRASTSSSPGRRRRRSRCSRARRRRPGGPTLPAASGRGCRRPGGDRGRRPRAALRARHGPRHRPRDARAPEPVAGRAPTTPLPSPTVFSVEPGVYLAGRTGVRIEDLVLLDAARGRVERLTRFPRDVLVLPGRDRAADGRRARVCRGLRGGGTVGPIEPQLIGLAPVRAPRYARSPIAAFAARSSLILALPVLAAVYLPLVAPPRPGDPDRARARDRRACVIVPAVGIPARDGRRSRPRRRRRSRPARSARPSSSGRGARRPRCSSTSTRRWTPRRWRARSAVEPAAEVTLGWSDDGRRLSVQPVGRLAAGHAVHGHGRHGGPGSRRGRALERRSAPASSPGRRPTRTLVATDRLASGVALDSAIVVSFDRPVSIAGVLRAFRIAPAVPGSSSSRPTVPTAAIPAWPDNFVWEPTEPLAGDTRYTVDARPRRPRRGRLAGRRAAARSSFTTTTAPSVVRFRPRAGTRGRRPRRPRLGPLHRAGWTAPRRRRPSASRSTASEVAGSGRLRRGRHRPACSIRSRTSRTGPPWSCGSSDGARAAGRRVPRPGARRHLHRRRRSPKPDARARATPATGSGGSDAEAAPRPRPTPVAAPGRRARGSPRRSTC